MDIKQFSIELGMDYTEIAKEFRQWRTWFGSVRQYEILFSYENGGDNKDHRVMGGNPCLEQSLNHMNYVV